MLSYNNPNKSEDRNKCVKIMSLQCYKGRRGEVNNVLGKKNNRSQEGEK